MGPGNIMLRGRSWSTRATCYMIPLRWNVQNRQVNRDRLDEWFPGAWEDGDNGKQGMTAHGLGGFCSEWPKWSEIREGWRRVHNSVDENHWFLQFQRVNLWYVTSVSVRVSVMETSCPLPCFRSSSWALAQWKGAETLSSRQGGSQAELGLWGKWGYTRWGSRDCRVVASGHMWRGSRETGTRKPVSAGNSEDVRLHALTAIDA